MKKTNWRCLILFLICFIPLSNFYVLLHPVPLQLVIMEKLQINFTQYNLLYSIYGFPNILLCFFSGNIVHKLGLQSASIIFMVSQCLGNLIFIFGIYTSNYYLCLFGRLFVGSGGELLQCIGFVFLHKWFSHR